MGGMILDKRLLTKDVGENFKIANDKAYTSSNDIYVEVKLKKRVFVEHLCYLKA